MRLLAAWILFAHPLSEYQIFDGKFHPLAPDRMKKWAIYSQYFIFPANCAYKFFFFVEFANVFLVKNML